MLKADDTEKIRNANIDPRGPFYLISHGFLEGGHKLWVIIIKLTTIESTYFLIFGG